MRLAVSNIAWPAEMADDAYELLAELEVHGLEIAPALLFPDQPDPFVPSREAVKRTTAKIASAGLQLVSMQSLLYGTRNAFLFGSPEETASFEDAIRRAVDLAGRLGVANLVIGSPKNRIIPDEMERAQAWTRAAEIFRRLGDYASHKGTVLAMEPNPEIYGTNFLNRMQETLAFVREVAHSAVALNFDIGSLVVNDEIPEADNLLDAARGRISHVHISSPNLLPVPADPVALRRAIGALKTANWNGFASIEMRAVPTDPLAAVRRAITACRDAIREA